jgi:histone H3/H4
MAEEFTITPMRRLLKKAGDLRISDEAAEEFRRVIGEIGSQLASFAVQNAGIEGRKTIIERDIRVGLQKLMDSEVRKNGDQET